MIILSSNEKDPNEIARNSIYLSNMAPTITDLIENIEATGRS